MQNFILKNILDSLNENIDKSELIFCGYNNSKCGYCQNNEHKSYLYC